MVHRKTHIWPIVLVVLSVIALTILGFLTHPHGFTVAYGGDSGDGEEQGVRQEGDVEGKSDTPYVYGRVINALHRRPLWGIVVLCRVSETGEAYSAGIIRGDTGFRVETPRNTPFCLVVEDDNYKTYTSKKLVIGDEPGLRLDIELEPIENCIIGCSVVDGVSGVPVAGVWVKAKKIGSDYSNGYMTDANGLYGIAVEPGEYVVTVTDKNKDYIDCESDTFALADGQTKEVGLELKRKVAFDDSPRNAVVKGTLRWAEYNFPLYVANVRCYSVSAEIRLCSRTMTDREGRYYLDVPADTDIKIQFSRWLQEEQESDVFQLEKGGLKVIDLAMHQKLRGDGVKAYSCTLKGTVIDDATGKPIPGLSPIICYEGGARGIGDTDIDGRYWTKVVPGKIAITVTKPGYIKYAHELDLEDHENVDHEIRVKKGVAYLEGVVIDADTGESLVGANLGIAASGREGKFRVEVIPGRSYGFDCTLSGYKYATHAPKQRELYSSKGKLSLTDRFVRGWVRFKLEPGETRTIEIKMKRSRD